MSPPRSTGDPTVLQQQRVGIKRLQDRLFELSQVDEDAAISDTDTPSDNDDTAELLRRYAPAMQANDSLDVQSREPRAPDSMQTAAATFAAGALGSSLRSRRGREAAMDSATASGREGAGSTPGSKQSTVTSPFAPKPAAADRPSDTETLLSHHTAEQENITDSLLSLASALKNSTMSFSESLATSSPLVDRAAGSLDRNVGGMEAAEKRMGMLRRMTEGRGWWSRLGLYGWIAVLWVALILIMFVMPKLRF